MGDQELCPEAYKAGTRLQEEERRGLAALLLQHWEEKASVFKMVKSFQSYNIEEKSKLGQLEREEKEVREINIR